MKLKHWMNEQLARSIRRSEFADLCSRSRNTQLPTQHTLHTTISSAVHNITLPHIYMYTWLHYHTHSFVHMCRSNVYLCLSFVTLLYEGISLDSTEAFVYICSGNFVYAIRVSIVSTHTIVCLNWQITYKPYLVRCQTRSKFTPMIFPKYYIARL